MKTKEHEERISKRIGLSVLELLAIIPLVGLVTALVLSGYSTRVKHANEYNFKGKIRGEEVEVIAEGFDRELKVDRDGREIMFYDAGSNEALDWIVINGKRYGYRNDFEKPIFEEAQKQYSEYLKEIQQIKTQEGLEAISRTGKRK